MKFSDGLKRNLGRSSSIIISSSLSSPYIRIEALPLITLKHIKLCKCKVLGLQDPWHHLYKPASGRQKKQRWKSWDEKERKWMGNNSKCLYTHPQGEENHLLFSFVYFLFFSSFGAEGFISHNLSLCWNFIDFSSQYRNTDVKQQKKSVWVYKRAILPRGCSSSEIWESNIQCTCKAYGSLLLLKIHI